MDENYLDSLLGGASSGDNNNFDNNVDADSGVDIDMSDLRNISLDELDDLDSLDLGDLELDDIDFDDVDVTKTDAGEGVEKAVNEEAKKGFDGRFGAGTPGTGDMQLLFFQHALNKLDDIVYSFCHK